MLFGTVLVIYSYFRDGVWFDVFEGCFVFLFKPYFGRGMFTATVVGVVGVCACWSRL